MVFNKFLHPICHIYLNDIFYQFPKFTGNSTTQKCSMLKNRIFSSQNKQHYSNYFKNSKKSMRLYLHRHGQYLSYLVPDLSTYVDKKR